MFHVERSQSQVTSLFENRQTTPVSIPQYSGCLHFTKTNVCRYSQPRFDLPRRSYSWERALNNEPCENTSLVVTLLFVDLRAVLCAPITIDSDKFMLYDVRLWYGDCISGITKYGCMLRTCMNVLALLSLLRAPDEYAARKRYSQRCTAADRQSGGNQPLYNNPTIPVKFRLALLPTAD